MRTTTGKTNGHEESKAQAKGKRGTTKSTTERHVLHPESNKHVSDQSGHVPAPLNLPTCLNFRSCGALPARTDVLRLLNPIRHAQDPGLRGSLRFRLLDSSRPLHFVPFNKRPSKSNEARSNVSVARHTQACIRTVIEKAQFLLCAPPLCATTIDVEDLASDHRHLTANFSQSCKRCFLVAPEHQVAPFEPSLLDERNDPARRRISVRSSCQRYDTDHQHC